MDAGDGREGDEYIHRLQNREYIDALIYASIELYASKEISDIFLKNNAKFLFTMRSFIYINLHIGL